MTVVPERVGNIAIAGLPDGRVLAAWSARATRYAPLHLYGAIVTPGMPVKPQRLDPDGAWTNAFRGGPVRVVTQWDGSAAVVASAAGGPGALVIVARRPARDADTASVHPGAL